MSFKYYVRLYLPRLGNFSKGISITTETNNLKIARKEFEYAKKMIKKVKGARLVKVRGFKGE